jgi:phage-related minor tail protein
MSLDSRVAVRERLTARYSTAKAEDECAKGRAHRKRTKEAKNKERIRNRNRRQSAEGVAYMKEYRAANKGRIAAQVKRYYTTTKGKYRHAKAKAKAKAIEFKITEKEYTEMVSGPCEYCGGPLPRHGHGIDRMDSRVGYVLTNCVPCCAGCNMVKGSMPADVWLVALGMILEAHDLEAHENPWESEAISWMLHRRKHSESSAGQ